MLKTLIHQLIQSQNLNVPIRILLLGDLQTTNLMVFQGEKIWSLSKSFCTDSVDTSINLRSRFNENLTTSLTYQKNFSKKNGAYKVLQRQLFTMIQLNNNKTSQQKHKGENAQNALAKLSNLLFYYWQGHQWYHPLHFRIVAEVPCKTHYKQ